VVRPPQTPKIVEKPADGPGYYTVKKGDTLIRVALDHGQNYRDLVVWNNLSNPNDIKVDQVLRVVPPDAGASKTGVQIERVSAAPALDKSAKPATTTSVPPAAGTAVAVVNKSSPRGDKRPYSEATLAELQKTDATSTAIASAPTTAVPNSNTSSASAGAAAGASVSPGSATASAGASASASAADESLSWVWPTDGRFLSGFDEGKNKGIDIAGKSGQQIIAAGAGKVMYAGSVRGYGNLVIVRHSNNLLSAYAHNQSLLVKEGQVVQKGQQIAEMGNSDTDSVKLHFEIRQQGKPVDPIRFLPNR
jgi:lipoprotein NlpD